MATRLSRHLDPALFASASPALLTAAGRAAAPHEPPLPPEEFNWHDHTVMLLHVAARIEHALMVQYLFAAYSLGGPDVPRAIASDVRRWQETILGIAKEEMGHLVTVLNILTVLGGPLELQRDDFPIDSSFYPFDFSLERLSLDSLAKYVVAESPPDVWHGRQADEIRARAKVDAGKDVIEVAHLYRLLAHTLADPHKIPATAFHADTLDHQASWDEWGRGYAAGQRGRGTANVPRAGAPEVLVLEAYNRDKAVEAINKVGEQGEGVTPQDDLDDETSHFRRFLEIYDEMSELEPDDLKRVARRVAPNPTVGRPEQGTSPVGEPLAKLWAHLFNVRYRMLLVNLGHAFLLAGPATESPRGALVHRTFAEMYNLRTISGKLVALPLEDGGDANDACAGPPFQMPYTLHLPVRARDRAQLHLDLIGATDTLIGRLREQLDRDGRPNDAYLDALAESDRLAAAELGRLEVHA